MKKSLPLFALVTLLFVIAAWFSVHQRSPEIAVEKEPLFPELADKIQDVAKVEIKTSEHTTVLAAKGDQWVLENRGGYPAFFNRIKPLVIAISKLEIREAKTANPELFSRLQLEDVNTEKAKSKQVILQDAEGNTLASLLVGKDRVNRSDGSTDSLYVRKTGEEQTYLVKGEVMLSAEPADWLENSLIDLSSDRLQSITIKHGGDKTVQASRGDKDSVNYELQNVPDGFKLKSQTTLNSLASAVEELRFDDVNSAAEFKSSNEMLTTIYETFDGLVANIKSTKINDQIWATYSFEYMGEEESGENGESKKPSVKQQVEMLNAKTKGWIYALPSYKGQMLTRVLTDLIIEEGTEKESPKTESSSTDLPPQLPPGITPEMLQNMMPGQGMPAPK